MTITSSTKTADAFGQSQMPTARFGQMRPPHIQLAWLVALFALVWTVSLAMTSTSPPADNIEQMLWVQSLQWGYHKHPPLPTWLFWIPAYLFGNEVATTYLAAALANLASICVFWQLLRQLRGPQFAFIAVLAVLCISYYNARFTTYNHNTVLMLVSTGCAALCWQACTTGRLRWWMALGVALGLGLLTKYQIAVSMTSVIAFWLTQGGWKQVAMRRGLLVAGLIALLMFVPHVQWLRDHDFGPIGYAIDSSLGASLTASERLLDVLNWLADQLLNRALAAWILLIAVVAMHRHANRADFGSSVECLTNPCRQPRDAAHAFLLCWGLTPLVFMPLVGLIAGSHLHLPWGTAFLLFAVPMVMELLRSRVRWDTIRLARVTVVFVAVQAASLLLSIGTSAQGPKGLRDQHWRSFDSAAMAAQLEPVLRKALAGNTLAAIDGPEVLAGALALQLPEKPVVLIDGRLDRSPWVSPAILASGPTLHLQVGDPMPASKPVSSAFPGIFWRLSWPALLTPTAQSLAPHTRASLK